MMMVEGAVGELAQRYYISRLMEWPDDECRRVLCSRGLQAESRDAHHARSVPGSIGVSADGAKGNTLGNQRAGATWQRFISNSLEVGRDLAGQHFNKPGAGHPNGLAEVGDGLQRSGIADLIGRSLSARHIAAIKRSKIEALAQHKDIGGDV